MRIARPRRPTAVFKRKRSPPPQATKLIRYSMVAGIVFIVLLAVVLAVIGFWAAIKVLWILALVLLAIWLVGFFARGAEGARWYRW